MLNELLLVSWEADARLNVALGWTVIFYCCFLLQFLSGHLVKHRLAHFLSVCVCERSFSRQSLNLHVSAALSQRIMSSTLYVKMTRFPQTVPLFQRPTCLFVKHILSFSYSFVLWKQKQSGASSFKLAARWQKKNDWQKHAHFFCFALTDSHKQEFDSFQLKAVVFLKRNEGTWQKLNTQLRNKNCFQTLPDSSKITCHYLTQLTNAPFHLIIFSSKFWKQAIAVLRPMLSILKIRLK